MAKPAALPSEAKSIVTVGDGRGFVVNYRGNRLVVTAARCLPHLPPCRGASCHSAERTFPALISALGETPFVDALCLFADPVADIALLGSPDEQEPYDEVPYDKLMEDAAPLAMADAPERGQAWLLSLGQKWFRCTIEYAKELDGPLWISATEQPIVSGMLGSPIVSDNRAAMGICCPSSVSSSKDHNAGGPNPRLFRDLPAWLLRDL